MWCVSPVKIYDATQRSTHGDFLRALERPRPSDIYSIVVFSEYAEATLRERERKGTLGRTTVCKIRGGQKQQDNCIVIDNKKKKVVLLEMSCPWVSNRAIKCAENTSTYAPLRYELRRRYPGYKTEEHNIIIDELGESSRSAKERLGQLVGSGRCNSVFKNMQKAVVSSSLNIARTFKVLSD